MRPKRSVVHLLLAFAVVLCGLHVGEPAHAAEDPLHVAAHVLPGLDASGPEPAPAKGEPAGDHCCPMAPETAAAAEHAIVPLFAIHCALPVAALRSLTRAPPLEPPAA